MPFATAPTCFPTNSRTPFLAQAPTLLCAEEGHAIRDSSNMLPDQQPHALSRASTHALVRKKRPFMCFRRSSNMLPDQQRCV
jgi:hypothetical protein